MSIKDTYPYPLFEQARKNCPNPFNLQKIISATEVWGEVMTNLPNLNSHIDEQIFRAVFEIRRNYSHQIGIAIKGDRGTGKSHVIHRVWKKIAQDGDAVFAYMGPGNNPQRLNSHVLSQLANSFKRRDVQGVTQWEKLAVSTINRLKGTRFEQQYRPYIEKCNSPKELQKYIRTNVAKENRKPFFDDLVEAILELEPDTDLNFLRALLLLLSSPIDAGIALDWIKGTDNPELKRVGLPESAKEEQEDKSIWMIEQICKLAKSASLPVIICFDQIDNPNNINHDSGDSPPEIIASCIDRIYLQCSNIVIICCLLSDAWRDIEQMGSGIPDRVSERSVTAKPPTVQEMIELVKQRLIWFYQKNNLSKNDYPDLFPFDEAQIKKVASEGAGVRDLMKYCAENFEPRENQKQVLQPQNPLEKKKKEFMVAYEELLGKIDIPIKDDDKLAAIIGCCMKMIPPSGTENVVIKQVSTIDYNSRDLHLTVSGYDSKQQRDVKIGIRVCETTNGNSFNAVIRRLLNYQKYRITRGCLVRSTPVPRNWKTGTKLKEQLVNEQKGEVVLLKKNEIKPLVAIRDIYEQAEHYDFTKQEVIEIVKELKLAADNPLIREILSAP
ncbi:MAG: hypothetical protein SWZ49_07195 [Cyanobacteriota bacterium]|nr:hypothetical protein [Cyanobacteriota bacterium]